MSVSDWFEFLFRSKDDGNDTSNVSKSRCACWYILWVLLLFALLVEEDSTEYGGTKEDA